MSACEQPLEPNPGSPGAARPFIPETNGRPVILSLVKDTPNIMHKMGGRWYYVITAYVLAMTVVYALIL